MMKLYQVAVLPVDVPDILTRDRSIFRRVTTIDCSGMTTTVHTYVGAEDVLLQLLCDAGVEQHYSIVEASVSTNRKLTG